MRRIGPVVAVVLFAAVGCSGPVEHRSPAGHQPGEVATASASPDASAAASASALTEASTCAEYLHANKNTRYAFIQHEWQTHTPQTAAPVTLSSSFAPREKPTVADGNKMAATFAAGFLGGTLDNECPTKLSTRIMTLLAPAWQSSTTPTP